MFSLNAQREAPSDEEVKAQVEAWGFTENGIGLNDAQRKGIETYFPGATGWRGTMLLKPGFEVVKTGFPFSDFEKEIDAVLADL